MLWKIHYVSFYYLPNTFYFMPIVEIAPTTIYNSEKCLVKNVFSENLFSSTKVKKMMDKIKNAPFYKDENKAFYGVCL